MSEIAEFLGAFVAAFLATWIVGHALYYLTAWLMERMMR